MSPILIVLMVFVGIPIFLFVVVAFHHFCDWIIYRIAPFQQEKLTFTQWLAKGCPKAESSESKGDKQ